MTAYHSALHPPVDAPAIERHTWPNGSVAFVSDVTAPEVPPEFRACDILYSDPPWAAGVEVFDERAGRKTVNGWRGIMDGVRRRIERFPGPVILIVGMNALRYLPRPVTLHKIHLVGRPAQAAVFNWSVPGLAFATTDTLLDSMARRYDCVGDFCCGYGSAAVAFHRAGKRFVATDYNPHCIGKLVELVGD